MQIIVMTCLLLTVVLLGIFARKYKAYGGGVFFNPILYLSGTSILYLLLPIVVIYGFNVNNAMLDYSEGSDKLNSFLSTYTVAVFVFFYWISNDVKVDFERGEKINVNFIYIILILACGYFAYLAFMYKDELGGIILREAKYDFFSEVILGANPKILLVSKISGLLIAFCYFMKKRFWILLLLIPFIYFDSLIKGRSITLYAVLPSLVVILFYFYRYFLIIIVTAISTLALISFFREVAPGRLFFTMFGEFFATRESTSFVIDGNSHDSFIHLLSNFFYAFLPTFIASKFNFYSMTAYTPQLEGLINGSIGFSGNIIGESYFYGGFLFSLINPFIISLIYLYIQKLSVNNKYHLLYMIMLCSYSIWFMRSEFYVTFASLTSMFLVYIFPVLFISRSRNV